MKNEYIASFSVEELLHFHCSECGEWWTQEGPDLELYLPSVSEKWVYCPWCGTKLKPHYIGVN